MTKRMMGGIIYFLAGFSLTVILLALRIETLKAMIDRLRPFLWCVAWALMGAGAGLINARIRGIEEEKKKNGEHSQSQKITHIVFYWGFVIVIGSLAAFSLALINSGMQLQIADTSVAKFYSFSALIGLIVGFIGDKLYEKLGINT